MDQAPSILWFQGDLRLTDNPALHAALREGKVIPVYIHAPEEDGPWSPGGASRWWLHHSLSALAADLNDRGSRLILRHGPSAEALLALCAQSGARRVIWNRSYAPSSRSRDQTIANQLKAAGITVRRFHPPLLFPRGRVLNKSGNPYKVFTPFWRNCLAQGLDDSPTAAPTTMPKVPNLPSLTIEALNLLPTLDWHKGFYACWQPGESGAVKKLKHFCEHHLVNYAKAQDILAEDATSALSPHLHFGEITPRQIIARIHEVMAQRNDAGIVASSERFLAELGWREFAHHILYYFPHTTAQPLNARYSHFPWRTDTALLHAWQQGHTGIPVVDAGMRQLWQTGTMHNRVRMIAASFLTKNCRVHWLEGARWFWDTLVDADLAANTLNWQWVAGCGADAAPYYRIFNPVTQSRRFDPAGAYLRRWLPELSRLPDRHIHAPWEAAAKVLTTAQVKLGKDYPLPVIDPNESRKQALAAYQKLQQAT